MLTTVVGSFPRLAQDHSAAVRAAVELQLRYGIEIVSDGEQRADMIGYFEAVPGLERVGGRLRVVDRIGIPEPEGFPKLVDLHLARKHLKARGYDPSRLKVAVTGPVTLGFTTAMNGLAYYKGITDSQLYTDLAEALAPIAEAILQEGAYLQVDEPGLGEMIRPEEGVKYVNRLLEGLPSQPLSEGRVILHTCGRITRRLADHLPQLVVSTLSLAFTGSEAANIEMIECILRRKDLRLGVGCIPVVARSQVELGTIEEALEIVGRVVQQVGRDRVALIHPSCGLRNTPRRLIEPILKMLSDVGRQAAHISG
jgi:5-methyltetrahydropteroyltriglutamate--homocysteine methyltransferase